MPTKVVLMALASALAAAGVHADVADSAAGGFTVKVALNVQASPADVYQRLIHVGDWWSSEHTFSLDAHNLSIDVRPMGCFCEKLERKAGRGGLAVR